MSDAPERIWLAAGTGEPVATRDDWTRLIPRDHNAPYILATPEALAASPEVQTLILEAVEKERNVFTRAIEKYFDGTAVLDIEAEAAAIRAGKE